MSLGTRNGGIQQLHLGMDESRFLTLADAYKTQIYTKLLELAPERLGRFDPTVLEGRTTEEVLALIYMQGVAEALDAFDVSELLRAVKPVAESRK